MTTTYIKDLYYIKCVETNSDYQLNNCEVILPIGLIEYKNWLQCPRYIPVDSHKRSHSTAVANSLSYLFVSPIIIWNTRNTSGERQMTDVLQEEDKKTAETEVGRVEP